MLKRVGSVAILLVVLLTACEQEQTNPTPTPMPPTPTATLQLRPSPTPGPTYTPLPTFTSTLGSIPVSTFVPARAVTFTPAPAAQCPPGDPGLVIPTAQPFWEATVPFTEQTILSQLNAGGAQAVYAAFSWYAEEYDRDDILSDLTGDGVPELIISLLPSLDKSQESIFIFGCREGHYETLLQLPPRLYYSPHVKAIRDMNMDGQKELVTSQLTCEPACLGVQIFEWDGNQFQSLARDWYIDGNLVDFSDMVGLMGFANAQLEDLDGNGTVELIVDGGTPSYLGGSSGWDGPYRAQTVVYGWDGRYFVRQSQHYASPNFRFEAIQDGDTESSRGNYDEAYSFYLQAIIDSSLKSWSHDTWYTLLEQNPQQDYLDIVNMMPFNQTEYDQLSAYAWYRIILLHLLHGHEENEAYIVYKWLLDHYPEGNLGYPYAQMATSFWIKYQANGDLASACSQARNFADQHPEILNPLGNHGLFDLYYVPWDVCPFSVITPKN